VRQRQRDRGAERLRGRETDRKRKDTHTDLLRVGNNKTLLLHKHTHKTHAHTQRTETNRVSNMKRTLVWGRLLRASSHNAVLLPSGWRVAVAVAAAVAVAVAAVDGCGCPLVVLVVPAMQLAKLW
jgi:anti-sigma-K factor RskA